MISYSKTKHTNDKLYIKLFSPKFACFFANIYFAIPTTVQDVIKNPNGTHSVNKEDLQTQHAMSKWILFKKR